MGLPDSIARQLLRDVLAPAQLAGAVVQISVRVRPGRQWAVEADLRQRALNALAARGIRIDTRISATIQEGTIGR